jgi:hypothetical protein
VFTVFFAGAADRILVSVGIPYETQVWLARGAFFVAPVVVGVAAYRIASELRRSDLHPLRGAVARRVVRRPDGSFATVADDAEPGAG